MNELNIKLKPFSTQVEKFEKHMSFFKNLKAEIKFEQGVGSSITISNINEETLISVLVHFRNFYMKTSELYFGKIVQYIIDKPEVNFIYKEISKEFLTVWQKLLDENQNTFGGMSLQANQQKLTAKRNLDIWMNEGYLHVDQYELGSNKGLDIIKSQAIFEGLSKVGMVGFLQDLCGLIIAFKVQVVEKIIQDSK